MCLNVFMPFIDKYITIGGEGGGGLFQMKTTLGRKGVKRNFDQLKTFN